MLKDSDDDDHPRTVFKTKQFQVRESLLMKDYDEQRERERQEYAKQLEKMAKMLEESQKAIAYQNLLVEKVLKEKHSV